MPYKNPKDKLAAMRRWRQSSTPEYHRWLYARRSLRFSKAEKFEQLLGLIASGDTPQGPQKLAQYWLLWFEEEENRIGRFFDHAKNEPSNERTVHFP